MQVVNYQKELDKILSVKENFGKKLLLHCCCAPCSSYVLTYLSSFFDITVYFYNPNITDEEEYVHRLDELKRLVDTLNRTGKIYPWAASDVHIPISLSEAEFEPQRFLEIASGLEDAPEGGARCAKCFGLRFEETCRRAKEIGADYFGTTLTISPLKNAEVINAIGTAIAGGTYDAAPQKAECSNAVPKPIEGNPIWLPSDFKKRDGYKHSIELSAEYGLYRQNYCGCEFSRFTN